MLQKVVITMNVLHLVILLCCICFQVNGNGVPEKFLIDIFSVWNLRSPTIIVEESLPMLCMTHNWVLCLPSKEVDMNQLIHHLAMLHYERKQDSLFFAGGANGRDVVRQLSLQAPTFFRSNCPVFTPTEFVNGTKLRLDSNVIAYNYEDQTKINLIDIFAVKGGPTKTLNIGFWVPDKGVTLQDTFNRWDRRTDLFGEYFINALTNNGKSAYFTEETNGIGCPALHYNGIFGKGTNQEILFYILKKLNLTCLAIPHDRVNIAADNGSWTGGIGLLQRMKADIVTSGLGLSIDRAFVIDYLIPTVTSTETLIARTVKSTSPKIWVYLQVFGPLQWSIYIALLIAVILIYSSARIFKGQNKSTQRKVHCILSGVGMTYLYIIQMGHHTNDNQLASRMLSVTMAFLTMLIFIHYTTDITAEMTSGSEGIPIRNFEDVLHYDYKVTTDTDFYKNIFASAAPGSGMHKIYKKYLENSEHIGELKDVESYLNLLSEPKTLFFGPKEVAGLSDDLTALKLDDEIKTQAGLMLQKDSEFLQIFNYYVLKQFETGILKRILHEQEEKVIGILEPEPLGYDNVVFLSSVIVGGVCVSFILVLVESVIKWAQV